MGAEGAIFLSSLADGLDPNTGNQPGIIMNSLPSNVANRYIAHLNEWIAKYEIVSATYDRIAGSTLDEYQLTSGDGMTRAKRRSLKEMGEQLMAIESRFRYYEMKVYGRGIMTLRFRRKS